MYCLLIKAILGLNVCQSCYGLVEKKMIDKEKYEIMELMEAEYAKKKEESQMKRRQGYYNLKEMTLASGDDNLSKSRLSRVTLNAIQVKLQKRKLKTNTKN